MPLPYCDDLMSVSVALCQVGGKVPALLPSPGGPHPCFILHPAVSLHLHPLVGPHSFRTNEPLPPVFVFKGRNQKESLITIKCYRHLELEHKGWQHRAHWGYQQGAHWSIGSLIEIVWQTPGRGRRRKQSSKIPLSSIEKFVTESVGRGCQERLGGMKGLGDQTGSVPTLHI